MGHEADSAVLVDRYFREVVSAGDAASAAEILSDEVVYRNLVTSLPTADALLEYIAMLRTAFPDLSAEREIVRFFRDGVTVRFTLRGTHRGDFHGVAATARPVAVKGVATFRIEAGRIAEISEALDPGEILRQLGAL